MAAPELSMTLIIVCVESLATEVAPRGRMDVSRAPLAESSRLGALLASSHTAQQRRLSEMIAVAVRWSVLPKRSPGSTEDEVLQSNRCTNGCSRCGWTRRTNHRCCARSNAAPATPSPCIRYAYSTCTCTILKRPTANECDFCYCFGDGLVYARCLSLSLPMNTLDTSSPLPGRVLPVLLRPTSLANT